MSDPTSADADVMPGDAASAQEIVARNNEPYAVEVMPLMQDDEIRRTWRVAKALAASGMFKDARQGEQAFAKILLGRDLGLSPTQAMTGIHIVEGKPEVAAVTLASFVRRREGHDYKILEHTNELCSIEFLVDGESRGISTFTQADAEAGLLNLPTSSGHPSNYVKFPRNMLFARAMSNGVKWFVPECTGGIPVYFEGEIQPEPVNGHGAAAGGGPTGPAMPEHLAALVARAVAVDSSQWRETELAARLPLPGDDGYDNAVGKLAEELTGWLDENEPTDADVVPEGEDVADRAGQEVAGALQARWDADPEWRDQVEPVLDRYGNLETALDLAVEMGEDKNAEAIRGELKDVADQLDALEVPLGWWPETADTGAEQ
jgi:hypothetical protein